MEKYYYAKGRRKTSVATVRLFEGKGASLINEKPAEEVYVSKNLQNKLYLPLKVTNNNDKFYFTAKTSGGGKAGQLDAIVHGLSRSLVVFDKEFKKSLKQAGLLTRDDRKVERKKTGLRKARKAPQFSKR